MMKLERKDINTIGFVSKEKYLRGDLLEIIGGVVLTIGVAVLYTGSWMKSAAQSLYAADDEGAEIIRKMKDHLDESIGVS